MNPLFGGGNQMNPQMLQSIQQIKGLMNQMKSIQNPNLAIQQMAEQNPQMKQILQMCQGQNPKDVFYSMCQQQGIDPEQVIKLLKS